MPSIIQSPPPNWAIYAKALFARLGNDFANGVDLDGPDGVVYPTVEQILPTVIDLDITPEGAAKKRILRLTSTCIEKDR